MTVKKESIEKSLQGVQPGVQGSNDPDMLSTAEYLLEDAATVEGVVGKYMRVVKELIEECKEMELNIRREEEGEVPDDTK